MTARSAAANSSSSFPSDVVVQYTGDHCTTTAVVVEGQSSHFIQLLRRQKAQSVQSVFFSAGFEGDSTRSAVQHSKKSVQFHASFEAGEQSCNLAFSSAILFLVQAVFDVFQLDSI